MLARILAAHPDVFSVPRETSAFVSDKGARWTKLSLLLLEAAVSRRSVWVEKTPGHIHHTGQILETIPGARFIVVTRDGRDVVTSLGQRYEGDFDRAFQRWVADSKASMLCIERGGSMLWRYEDFIEAPALSIERLCRFIGVAFDPAILDYHRHPVVWGRERRVRTEHSARRLTQVNQPITDYRRTSPRVSRRARRRSSWLISDIAESEPPSPRLRRTSSFAPRAIEGLVLRSAQREAGWRRGRDSVSRLSC
ncbi:MAG: sulfotransferase [Mesorhizobium sp.]|nr:MAG: sulfotransferase [Mesorhizobium sp.]